MASLAASIWSFATGKSLSLRNDFPIIEVIEGWIAAIGSGLVFFGFTLTLHSDYFLGNYDRFADVYQVLIVTGITLITLGLALYGAHFLLI